MSTRAVDRDPRERPLPGGVAADRRRPDAGGSGGGAALAVVRGFGRILGAMPRGIAAAAALGWMLLIYWLSSGPIDFRVPLPASGFLWNFAHAPVFGLLAALVATAAAPRPLPPHWPNPGRLAGLVAFLAVTAWAAADEYHQSRVDGRHGSLFDFATDVTAAASVLWVASYAGRRAASERGMRVRLGVALGLCAFVAGVTTLADLLGVS